MDNLGLQTTANPDRTLDIIVDGFTYHRYPIKTNLVQIGDSYLELIKKYAKPHYQEGDFLVLSEKVIAICQKRVVHESEVHPGWLAKLICKYVTKYPDDVGYENPRKMQVAINEAGYFRMVLAVIGGGILKYVFKKPGWFYRIAGNDINAIDGFNPIAIPPFNQYAMLGPADPMGTCDEIEQKLGIPCTIVDANNVNTEIMGYSKGLVEFLSPSLSLTPREFADRLRPILGGNPMGQEDEHTPMLLVRKA